jgi:hypothetical protein
VCVCVCAFVCLLLLAVGVAADENLVWALDHSNSAIATFSNYIKFQGLTATHPFQRVQLANQRSAISMCEVARNRTTCTICGHAIAPVEPSQSPLSQDSPTRNNNKRKASASTHTTDWIRIVFIFCSEAKKEKRTQSYTHTPAAAWHQQNHILSRGRARVLGRSALSISVCECGCRRRHALTPMPK